MKICAKRHRVAAARMLIECLESRTLLSVSHHAVARASTTVAVVHKAASGFSAWATISKAIANVPESAGYMSSVSVINFGTTVYTGPLNCQNTLDRIRADDGPVTSDDGTIFTNSEGYLPSGTTYYEFCVLPATGTDRDFTFASPGPMRIVMDVKGDVYFTGDHYDTFKTVYLVGQTGSPTIGSFTVTPASVAPSAAITLTASSVAESGGTISNVKFYRESNGTSGLQVGSDTLVGTGAQSGSTWTFSSTAPATAGSYTYYAVATDASGVASPASSSGLTVTAGGGGGSTGTMLGWDVASQTNYGTQGLAAGTVGTGITNSTGLTRGSGVTTSGTAASGAWGGANWASTAAAGITGNEFITFGATVSTGHTLSLSAIDLNYRRSSSGATNGEWQYEINTGSWVTISGTSSFSSTSSSGATMAELSLSGITALQSLAAGTKVTLRLIPYGASSTGGTFYIYDMTGTDLNLKGSTT